jgi:hypothetical protein
VHSGTPYDVDALNQTRRCAPCILRECARKSVDTGSLTRRKSLTNESAESATCYTVSDFVMTFSSADLSAKKPDLNLKSMYVR